MRAGIGACPACGSTDLRQFLSLPQVPVHCNMLYPSRDEATAAPRGDLRLVFCQACAHVFNGAFDPSLMEYTQAYENSLHFSPRFQQYAENLADDLIARYDIRGKTVIDIGCGKGDFLALLCERGENQGIGFDPSFVPEYVSGPVREKMTIVQDFYSARYADRRAELIVCRHVLEHVPDPSAFVGDVRTAVGEDASTVVFFEVPNVLYTLRDLGIWDLIYEHCSYFSPPSLAGLFEAQGFEVLGLQDLYGGQFLGIETRPGHGARNPKMREIARLAELVERFSGAYQAKVSEWIDRFQQMASARKRAVVWGGGSKGVTFLNTLRPDAVVTHMVDINPRKQGMYVAGTGQEVVSPEELRTIRPDMVIIMNPIYRSEIEATLRELGSSPEVLVG
jgi:SAM-dependent methyltransferase